MEYMLYIFDVALVIGLLVWCYYDKKKEKVAQQNQMLMQETWKARKEKADDILELLFEVREVAYCGYNEVGDSIVFDLSAFTSEECEKIENKVKNCLRKRIDLPSKKKERMIRQDVEVQKAFYTQHLLKIKLSVLDVMK